LLNLVAIHAAVLDRQKTAAKTAPWSSDQLSMALVEGRNCTRFALKTIRELLDFYRTAAGGAAFCSASSAW